MAGVRVQRQIDRRRLEEGYTHVWRRAPQERPAALATRSPVRISSRIAACRHCPADGMRLLTRNPQEQMTLALECIE
jgi:hypothetical protein